MFLGRFILGDFVPIPVNSVDVATPYAPTAAPLVSVYSQAGTKVAAFKIPPVDRGSATGLFIGWIRLGSTYATGRYRFAVNYVANSVKKLVVGHFEIVDGGHVDGAVISMAFYPRPHAAFLVQKLDSNQRLLVKNPRIT